MNHDNFSQMNSTGVCMDQVLDDAKQEAMRFADRLIVEQNLGHDARVLGSIVIDVAMRPSAADTEPADWHETARTIYDHSGDTPEAHQAMLIASKVAQIGVADIIQGGRDV